MNYNNKHTDKKLQELEQQSLPDLSKMDGHWQQMGLLLQPGPASLNKGKAIFRKKILFAIMSVAAVLAISFFLYQNSRDTKDRATKEITINKKIIPVDSPMLLKARTSDGRDTVIGVISINGNEKPVKSRLILERTYEELQKKPQRFIINNKRDTVINGKEGTRLFIPANSFDIKEDVTLLLTEFYSINDMIANKLTTTCNGRQLITGGMIYLDARDKDDNLVDLANNASLRLDMPKREGRAVGMQLFYGNDYYRNDVTTVIDSINWAPTNQLFANPRTEQPVIFEMDKNTETIRVTGTIDIAKKDTIRWKTFNKDSLIPQTNREARRYDNPTKTDSLLKATGINKDSLMEQRFGVNINRLGWINCDRFYSDPRPKVELIVDLGDDPNNYNTLLVFDKLNSIIGYSSKQGNIIRFSNVPSGETAKIVSLGVRNQKAVTAMQKITISKDPVSNMNFEEVTPLAFKSKLN